MSWRFNPASTVGPQLDESDDYAIIDLRLVQLATVAATLFLVLLTSIWLASGDEKYLIQAIAPAAVSTSGWVMLGSGRPSASLHLAIGALGMAVYVAAGEPAVPGDPLLGLFVMTIAGAALVRTHIVPYSALASLALGTAAFFWQTEDAPVSGRLVESFTAIVAFAITVWLLQWQRKRSERDRERLRRLIESKDEFVATISHELRTPLTAVVGVAHELHGHHADFSGHELEELTALLVGESNDMADIVEDLLVVARADVGTLTLDTQRVNLSHIASSVAGDLVGASVSVDVGPGIEVRADELRTRQIVRNLVGNALRYGGTSIRVTTTATAAYGMVEVRDDGPALSESDRNEIFEAYQSAASVAGKPGSMGLGLTVSRKLARVMDGDVTYDHDGTEAIFTLQLPLNRE